MPIDKSALDQSLRRVRSLYREHACGELGPSAFAAKARAELHHLYLDHTKKLVETTLTSVVAELKPLQKQFGLDLDFQLHWQQVTKGYRGIRAYIYVSTTGARFVSVQIYIGPFDVWNKIAVHTVEELERSFNPPSFYTKRRRDRWQEISSFDFPALLQQIKEEADKPEPESEKEADKSESEKEDEILF